MIQETQIVAGILLLFCMGLSYFLYLRRLDLNRRQDPRELTLDLDLPYRRAFDLAKRSFDSLPTGEVRSADEEKGIVEGWLPDTTFFGPGPAKITIMVQQTGVATSRVTIQGITPNPSHMSGPLIIGFFYSRNGRYVKWIRDFIVEPRNQVDGTLIDDREISFPEM